MKPILVALVLHLLALRGVPATHPIYARVDAAAEVVASEVPLVFPTLSAIEQDKRGRVSIAWGFWESGLQANPTCPPSVAKADCNDGGRACGWGQIHVATLPTGVLPPEMTCAAIRADLRTSVRAQLLVIHHLEKACGSLQGAMTAYATGRCPAKGWTIRLVSDRLKMAEWKVTP